MKIDQIKIGIDVYALRSITFADGTSHRKGDLITVNDENIYYFRHFPDDYEIYLF